MKVSVKNILSGRGSIIRGQIESIRIHSFYHRSSNFFASFYKITQKIFRCIQYVRIMIFWYNQSMTGLNRLDIQKRQGLLIFVDFAGRQLSGYNFAKNTVHERTFDL